mmetsp:Transcript_157093/g.481802  ORF Transcript_157093/g.481802 Transcript_157093/m.481802 type:complete len:83 (-) Transcript_157093:4-252(-)
MQEQQRLPADLVHVHAHCILTRSSSAGVLWKQCLTHVALGLFSGCLRPHSSSLAVKVYGSRALLGYACATLISDPAELKLIV